MPKRVAQLVLAALTDKSGANCFPYRKSILAPQSRQRVQAFTPTGRSPHSHRTASKPRFDNSARRPDPRWRHMEGKLSMAMQSSKRFEAHETFVGPVAPFRLRSSDQPYNTVQSVGAILVTGGTGFIGGAVLSEIYNTPHWPQILILVRAASIAEARQRIAASLRRFLRDGFDDANLADHQVLIGGLEDADVLARDPRLAAVTHVIHGAAVTSFANHPRINAINVDATLAFITMVRANCPLARFINIGTAWCVGLDQQRIVFEGECGHSDSHVVPYTKSKLELERRVRTTFPDLPFISARPSIVVGHTELGTQPSGSIYWVFRSAQLIGRFTCSFDERVDVVPVDWVAQAIVQLAFKRQLWHDTYHLSAGETSHSTIGDLDRAIAQGRNMPPVGRQGYRRIGLKDLAKAVYHERASLGDANPILLAKALAIYAHFAESGVVFENSRALGEGIPPPPPFYTYAALCARTSEATSLADQMADDFK